MAISKEEVRRIARLAHLEYPRVAGKDGVLTEPADHLIDDATLEALARDVGNILDHVRELDALDLTGVEPTSHAVRLAPELRADEPRAEPFESERVLEAAPRRVGEAVSVPRIVE